MKLEPLMSDYIKKATVDVFATMLGTELQPGETQIETGTPDASDGVVSFIGLAGTWAGTGSLSCSPALACRICSQMLMCETSAVNEEVLDTVAEVTNMIIGSVKTELEKHLGPLGLSIPTVVFGRNFKTKSAGLTEWVVVKYHWDEEPLSIKLCLTPSERSLHPVAHPAGQSCTLEM